MQKISDVKEITIATNGTISYTPVDTDPYSTYILVGSGTLTSSATISITGASTLPQRKTFVYAGTFALDGNNITIQSTALSAEQAAGGRTVIECVKKQGGSWIPSYLDSSTIKPKNVAGVETTTLDGNGGTITLRPGIDKQVQIFEGNGDTLVAGWVIEGGGSPSDDSNFTVIYKGNLVQDAGNYVTIEGQQLTAYQIANGGIYSNLTYDTDNTQWENALTQNPSFSSVGDYEVFVIPVSFETGEIITNKVSMPYNGTVTRIVAQVTRDLDPADDGYVVLGINGTPMTGSPIVLATPLAVAGYEYFQTISGSADFTAGQQITLECQKVTAGGLANLIIQVVRT